MQHQWAQRQAIEADAEALGVQVLWDDDATAAADDAPTFWLWPENVPAWALWCSLQTQWRVGVAGATGLDYTAALAVVRHRVQGRAAQQQAFDDVTAMERATLDTWASQKK